MEKLDKVIRALEMHEGAGGREVSCVGCPYEEYEEYCLTVLHTDALELLKEYRRRMPCAVDSTVYYYDDYAGVIVPGVVRQIGIYDAEGNGFVELDFEETDLKHATVDLKLWGVNLFPTREAAEEVNHEND